MANNEDTPFVIEFKQNNPNNYGAARQTGSEASAARMSSCSSRAARGSVLSNTSTLYCLHGKSKVEVRDHCHRQRSEGVDVTARKKLIIASVLCLLFMICEIIGGILSNSLAIATDAAHLLTDFASFMISLFAIWIAGRPSTQRMSFGWYRAEVIGALASVVMIWFITAILVWLAIQRIITGEFEVDAKIMLITSGLAILVNLIMGCQLQHGHTHGGHSHGGIQQKKNTNINTEASKSVLGNLTLNGPRTASNQNNPKIRPSAVRIKSPTSEISLPETTLQQFQYCQPDTTGCPASPNARIENGVADLAAVDGHLPPIGGLDNYSYQNSRPNSGVHAEMAAVMAETSVGSHHHGGLAAHDAVNLNVRAAYIHVIGDMLQSVGVFIAALMIFFRPDWVIVDPICTFIFSVIVIFTTFGIMKDALLVLMEGTPSYLHYAEVLSIFQQIEGVERVHNLRIWALSINKIALSVHLAIAPSADPKKILQDATTAVHLRYNFFETTIQIEDFTPAMEDCQQCTVPAT